jgi:hypothetical protein
MEKYSLNEGNESLKRILLMMNYDNKKTLEENTKVIFEQEEAGDLINKYGKKMGVTLPSDLATPAAPATASPTTAAPATAAPATAAPATAAPATAAPATAAPATAAPATAAPATPEVSLSYEDTVKKLQNLLITKYQAKLGSSGPNKDGVDGKIGKSTLDAIGDAIRTKFAKQPPTPTDGENKSTTPGTKDDETITPEDKPETTITPDATPAVNPGSVDDWK